MFSRKNQSVIVMVIVALVVGAMVLTGLTSTGGGSGDADDAGAGPEGSGELALRPIPAEDPIHELVRREADDPLALGEEDAPVVMIEYADFQCAFCGGHARGTHPELVEEYVEAGVLRIEFRNFPIYGPESDRAARAAWAAGQQGVFWEFYAAAFAEDAHQGSGKYSEDGVLELAEAAGVADLERFAEDLESAEAGESVERDANEGVDIGVETAPAFLINGHPVVGSQRVDVFRDAIDQLNPAADQN
ncbi:DsbA family protein [Streptomyces otsuchiensis]|uniref:DsbA family protein n=1 Tax=Streptomyces otsuchiensis TaxID=2681388 RepID=UPI001D1324FD|nr:DsbA family protein [Streptomyces otsuchiensis]